MSSSTPKRKSHKSRCGYKGYRVQAGDRIQTVDNVDDFRVSHLAHRKPAKLALKPPIDAKLFTLDTIEKTLNYAAPLQVERKHGHGFGSGSRRVHLTLSEIVAKLKDGDDTFYLTTQYAGSDDEDDDENDEGEESEESEPQEEDVSGAFGALCAGAEDSESDFEVDLDNLHDDYSDAGGSEPGEAPGDELRAKTLFQPPLTSTLSHTSQIPVVPDPFRGLYTQQINLWMGSWRENGPKPELSQADIASLGKYVPRGNSSGLHHDHADNLYCLTQGRKRFTLFSPENAEILATVGDVSCVYANGLIDYQVNENAPSWRSMREDGAIRAEWAHWMQDKADFSTFSEAYLQGVIENEPRYCGPPASTDPPSFSRIPPVLLHLDEVDPAHRPHLEHLANTHFPGLLSLPRLEVWLEPGELLYIPTGWFHEVTSFSATGENAHVALNWWFMPPVGSPEEPYEDDYWKEDFALTMAAVGR